MAALTDAAPPSRRQQNRLWDSDAWSCPDPERCVRCDCALASPSTPAAGIVKFILDNQAASYEGDDHEDRPGEDGERWFMVGCRRPYQYEPLAQGDLDREEGDEEDELAVLLLEEKTTLVVADDEDERQQHQVKSATEIKKKKKKADSSNSDDSSSSSNSSSSSGSSSSGSSSDSDDSSSSSNTSDSSDSSSSSNSSSSSSSSSSSGSSDSSTLSDSSASDSSGAESQKKKKRKHHPSNSNSKQRDSCSKGGNISQNKNPVRKNSHAPLVATAKDNGNSDDYDDDNDEPSKGVPPTTSVLSVVMKVPQTTSSHSTVEEGVSKAHRESGAELERKNSRKQSKRQHHKRDR